MKTRTLLSLMIAFFTILCPAVTVADAVSELKMAAELVNAQCPLNLGSAGTVNSVTFDTKSRTFCYHVNLNPRLATKESMLAQGANTIKNGLMAGFSSEETRPLMQLIYDAKAQFLMDYNIGSEHILDVILTTADVGQILNNESSDKENARQYLASMIEQEKLKCPISIGEGLIMTDAFIDGNRLCYTYTIVSPTIKIANLKAQDKTIHTNMIEGFKTDPTLRTIGLKCGIAGYTMEYIYLDPETKESYVLYLYPSELKTL